MSKSKDTGLTSRFADVAKELVEKGKVKRKITQLQSIMDSDKERLRNAYAELGKLYYDNRLDECKERAEVLSGLISHLKDRIERAKEKCTELEDEYSQREKADALKTDLGNKFKKAKDGTVDFAKNVAGKAKEKTGDIKGKIILKKGNLTSDESDFLEVLEKELKSDEETQDTAEKTMEKITDLLQSLEDSNDTEAIEIKAVSVTTVSESDEDPSENDIDAQGDTDTPDPEVAGSFTF